MDAVGRAATCGRLDDLAHYPIRGIRTRSDHEVLHADIRHARGAVDNESFVGSRNALCHRREQSTAALGVGWIHRHVRRRRHQ